MEKVNVLCLKWGRYYSVDYVNRLYANVKAHLKRPFRFVSVIDRTDGVHGQSSAAGGVSHAEPELRVF